MTEIKNEFKELDDLFLDGKAKKYFGIKLGKIIGFDLWGYPRWCPEYNIGIHATYVHDGVSGYKVLIQCSFYRLDLYIKIWKVIYNEKT